MNTVALILTLTSFGSVDAVIEDHSFSSVSQCEERKAIILNKAAKDGIKLNGSLECKQLGPVTVRLPDGSFNKHPGLEVLRAG